MAKEKAGNYRYSKIPPSVQRWLRTKGGKTYASHTRPVSEGHPDFIGPVRPEKKRAKSS